MNTTSSFGPMDFVQKLTARVSIPREIIWTVLGFSLFLPSTWKMVSRKMYYSSPQHLPHIILVSHVTTGLVEILAYYIPLYFHGAAPPPSNFFLTACVIHAITSIKLNANVPKFKAGTYDLVRATYNVMIVQRLLASCLAWYTGSLVWHKASVKLLSSFTWARLIIVYLAGHVAGFPSYAARYTAGIVGAEIMSVWEGDYPHGIIMYFLLGSALLWVDKWSFEHDHVGKRALQELGFVRRDQPDSKEVDKKIS